MISLPCTSCQKVLEIDDAFAGGVCRCQYCGTIQTVPKDLKQTRAGAPAAASTGAGGKTLYQKKPRQPGQPGTGLEDLADAVASSSGLARGALRSRAAAPSPPPPPPPPPKRNLLPVFVIISVVLLLIVTVLIVVLLLR